MRFEIFNGFELVDMVYEFASFEGERKYAGAGDFTLTLNSLEYVDSLKRDHYIVTGGDCYIIENIHKFKNEKNEIEFEVTGRHLNSILDRRVVASLTVGTGSTYEAQMYALVSSTFVNPSDADRKIDCMTMAAHNLCPQSPNSWEQGTIPIASGANLASTTRIRTISHINVSGNTAYTVQFDDALYDCILYEYNSAGAYIGYQGSYWLANSPYTFTTNSNTGRIRIIFRFKNDATITASEISNIHARLEVETFGSKPEQPYTILNKNVLEILEEICPVTGLGFRVNFLPESQQMEFEVYQGRDLTQEVFFSEDFGNVADSELYEQGRDYRNVGYLNNDGALTQVGNAAGLARREFILEGDSTDDVKAQLAESAVLISAECAVLLTEQFIYKEDWDLGDTVSFIDRRLGFIVEKPVMEIKETYTDKMDIDVVFGDRIPTVFEKLRR